MLFLQGTRDEFANLDLLQPLVGKLAEKAALKLFPDADHSFHVPKRSGKTDSEVRQELLNDMVKWMETKNRLT